MGEALGAGPHEPDGQRAQGHSADAPAWRQRQSHGYRDRARDHVHGQPIRRQLDRADQPDGADTRAHRRGDRSGALHEVPPDRRRRRAEDRRSCRLDPPRQAGARCRGSLGNQRPRRHARPRRTSRSHRCRNPKRRPLHVQQGHGTARKRCPQRRLPRPHGRTACTRSSRERRSIWVSSRPNRYARRIRNRTRKARCTEAFRRPGATTT